MKCTPRELQQIASVFSVAIADTEEGGAQWEVLRDLVVDFTGLLEKIVEPKLDRQQFIDDAGCYDLDNE